MRHPNKPDTFANIKALGLPIGTVIDVGVYHGTPELMSAFPSAEHILCEPLVECHEIIKTKYRAAGIKHILWGSAISDYRGVDKLKVSSVNGRNITHSTIDKAGERDIQVYTLDGVMAELDRSYPTPHLLKIDVDGNELGVLWGAENTLKACSVVVIEAVLTRFDEIYRAVAQKGFKLLDIVDLCYHDNRLSQVDLVFLRNDVYEGLPPTVFDIRKWTTYAH